MVLVVLRISNTCSGFLCCICGLVSLSSWFFLLFLICGLIDWHLGSSPNGLDAPRPYITGPLCPIICYQLCGALFFAEVPDGPQT
jgi:hypothetical protein